MLSIPPVALEVEGQGNHGGSIPAQRQRKSPPEGAGQVGRFIEEIFLKTRIMDTGLAERH